MIFNSFVFWCFFGVVIALYWRLGHRLQNRMLLVASYIFYGYWDWRFLGLIFISTVVDYFVATALERTDIRKKRKILLSVSIASNLGMLGFFKYFNFFVHEMAELLTVLGIQAHLPTLYVVLPVGISFYTFQTMSYTIDVYRGHTKPTRNFLDLALYVSFFPQLVAGPIERSHDLMPQILNPRKCRKGDFSEGLYHVVFGLFKKVVIADNMAPIVNAVFSTPTSELTGTEVLIGVYAFAFQIYGDFSGYSSIAQGIAKWMGIDLSWNFKMPYFAKNPSDFWRRWHISLSTWLRDYLYISLGGNKKGRLLTLRNLMLTMILGGLWHGAGWLFLIWGFWHGLLLIIYRIVGADVSENNSGNKLISFFKILLMFNLVCIGWLFFRAETLAQATDMLGLLFSSNYSITAFSSYATLILLFFVAPMLSYEFRVETKKDLLYILSAPIAERLVIYGYFMLMLLIFPPVSPQVFIYFQF
jgi:alginate O-acetyltransferase complex protein AlgI